MQVVDAKQTAAALPYPELIDALDAGFREGAEAPERAHHSVPLPDPASPPNTLILMPAWRPGEYLGVKVVTVAPGNRDLGRPAIAATYLLLDAVTGEPLLMIDGAELTARRTAAVSALAARRLAAERVETHLVVGAGILAGRLARAHRAVRRISRTLIWARRLDKAEQLAKQLCDEGIEAAAVSDLASAAGRAALISCATLAVEPVLYGRWLSPGVHLDLVGSYRPHMREADDQALMGARIFVDDLPGALSDTGELRLPLASGALQQDQIVGDLRALCSGAAPGRTGAEQRTVFKSVGTSLADYAAAGLVAERLGLDARGPIHPPRPIPPKP